jgi:hypothetical protein
MRPVRKMTPAYERALKRRRIVPGPPGIDGDCWLYDGARKGQPHADERDNDHRKIKVWDEVRGRSVLDYVHRVSYRQHHGPIPDGMVVRHRCDRRACFAPHHLTSGTNKENFMDAIERGRARAFVCPSQADAPGDGNDCPF